MKVLAIIHQIVIDWAHNNNRCIDVNGSQRPFINNGLFGYLIIWIQGLSLSRLIDIRRNAEVMH